jgi:beta-phosphoglucomutase
MNVSEDTKVVVRLPLQNGMALIFDLDGVIVDSMPLHTEAWQQYLDSAGINSAGVEARMHGRRNDEIVRDFFGPDLSVDTVFEHGAAKERLFRELMGAGLQRNLVPGIAEFLKRAACAPVALATNAEPANVEFVLDGAGLRDYFRVIVDGTQVAHAKPAPDVYLRAAEKLEVAPRNCIVFEDSPVGIASARAAGARVVGVLTHASELDHVDFAIRDFLEPELRLEEWLCAQRAV